METRGRDHALKCSENNRLQLKLTEARLAALVCWIRSLNPSGASTLEQRNETCSDMRPAAAELKSVRIGLPMFFTWEVLQSPFYMDTFTSSWTQVLYYRIHCTGGDMIILLGAFWLVALVWGRSWIEDRPVLPFVLFVASGVVYTIFSEYRNVHITQNWAYSSWMPTVRGIGLVPVFQWLVIPWLVVRAIRKSSIESER